MVVGNIMHPWWSIFRMVVVVVVMVVGSVLGTVD